MPTFFPSQKENVVYKLEKNKLDNFLRVIAADREVFALEQADSQYHLVRSDSWQADRHTLGAYRQVEPLKALVFRPREFLGSLGGAAPGADIPERIVIGAKNCDVAALKIHDYVFLNTEPVDPFYKEAREKTSLFPVIAPTRARYVSARRSRNSRTPKPVSISIFRRPISVTWLKLEANGANNC